MQGKVVGFSANHNRLAVLTEYGYTVFDIESGNASVYDVLTGNLDDHGSQVLTNQTTGQQMHVYIEAIQASKAAAESLLRCI